MTLTKVELSMGSALPCDLCHGNGWVENPDDFMRNLRCECTREPVRSLDDVLHGMSLIRDLVYRDLRHLKSGENALLCIEDLISYTKRGGIVEYDSGDRWVWPEDDTSTPE